MDFWKNPAFILRAVIALAYVALGIALLFQPGALIFLSNGIRFAFALLLIAYGSFRAYRAWQMFKDEEI